MNGAAGLKSQLAVAEVAGVGGDDVTFVVENGVAAFHGRAGKVAEGGVDSGDQEKEADDQQGEDFEKSFHTN